MRTPDEGGHAIERLEGQVTVTGHLDLRHHRFEDESILRLVVVDERPRIRPFWKIGKVSERRTNPVPHIHHHPHHPHHPGGEPDVGVQLNDNQQVDVQVVPLDAAGNQVTDLGTLTWQSSDETVLVVTPDANDSTKAVVATTGKLGLGVAVNVSDAEPGGADGTAGASFSATAAFDVVTGPVASLELQVGTPTDKAPAAPTDPGTGGTTDPGTGGTAQQLYTFNGDPTTVDTSVWVPQGATPDGQQLYSFTGDPATIDTSVWVAYSGPTA